MMGTLSAKHLFHLCGRLRRRFTLLHHVDMIHCDFYFCDPVEPLDSHVITSRNRTNRGPLITHR